MNENFEIDIDFDRVNATSYNCPVNFDRLFIYGQITSDERIRTYLRLRTCDPEQDDDVVC